MGITLHALVERRVVTPGRPPFWDELSRWDFGKDYRAMQAIAEAENAGKGIHRCWPADAAMERWEQDESGIDQGMRWCSADDLPLHPEPSHLWQSLQASLIPLLGPYELRVLFWEM